MNVILAKRATPRRPQQLRQTQRSTGPFGSTPSPQVESSPGVIDPSIQRNQSAERMNSTCFSSSNPAAFNATIVYDFNSDHESLWEKPGLQASLPLCSSSAPSPADSACLVCREQKVFAVCRCLPDGVKVMMEAMGNNMELTESGCPQLLSDGDLLSEGGPSWQLLGAIAVILLFLFIVISVICYRWRKKRCQRPEHQREEQGTRGENGEVLLAVEAESPV